MTLQYKTEKHLVTATYRVSFDVYGRIGSSCSGRRVAASRLCSRPSAATWRRPRAACALKGLPIRGPGADRIFVFQEFDQLLPWKTVKQNVMFALRGFGQDARQGGRGASHALHRQGQPHQVR